MTPPGTPLAGPSSTAHRVAAYRRRLERVPAAYGDATAEERLIDDLGVPAGFEPDDRMTRYLRARTAFFDRVVVNAIDRGVRQMVNVGAGYDGRALRYAQPGVRWFEVDRPATQQDKRARLAGLGIETAHITFAAVDLGDGGLAAALIGLGYEPDAPCQFLCEGVATYLPVPVLSALLGELRLVATVGTRLALSLRTVATSEEAVTRRRRLDAAVEAMGEPTRQTLDEEQTESLLTSNRWRCAPLSDKARRAGFVVATPLWAPAAPLQPILPGVRTSRVATFMEQVFHRAGTAGLAEHLEASYGIGVDRVTELDVGVFRVDRRDSLPWMVRVFPAARKLASVESDASILRGLQADGFPAERCAHPEAVSVLDGQGVLVTDHVAGTKPRGTRRSFTELGDLLGRLHTRTGGWAATAGPGGAWHHLALDGGPEEEKAAAISLVDQVRARVSPDDIGGYERLRTELLGIDAGSGLAEALVHPDFVPANVIVAAYGDPVLVDWTGAGRGPRLPSLAFLLWAAGAKGPAYVDAVATGYAPHVHLEADERARLGAVILARPLVLDCWSWCTGRMTLVELTDGRPAMRTRAEGIAVRALKALSP